MKPSNPEAFPRPASRGNNYLTGEKDVVVDPQSGMTLRDYFAAKAMQASISDADRPPAYTYEDKAKYAYEMADAMLKAREQ